MSTIKNVIKDNYNMMLLRDYLRAQIKDAGFSHVDIARTPMGTKVALYVTRPGIVIGRKGVGIRELTERLATDFGLKNPQITVNEIAKPELSPSVMCNKMASHLSRGIAFRRATMWTIQQIMEGNAMGVQITISGKLRGDRSAFEKHTAGILPRAGHHAQVIVDEDIAHVETPMGLIGIRIRIAKKDKYIPEFELKKGEKVTIPEPVHDDVKDATDPSLNDAKKDAESEAPAETEHDDKKEVTDIPAAGCRLPAAKMPDDGKNEVTTDELVDDSIRNPPMDDAKKDEAEAPAESEQDIKKPEQAGAPEDMK